MQAFMGVSEFNRVTFSSFLSFMFHRDTLIKNEIPALLAAISLSCIVPFRGLKKSKARGREKVH